MKEIVFLIIILFFLLFSFSFFSFLSKLSTSKQLLQRSTSFEQGDLHKDVSILVVGDSLGVGVGADDPRGSIAGRIGADLPHASVTNFSISGAHTKDIIDILKSLRADQFNLVVVIVGANDILQFTPLAELEQQIDTALSLAVKSGDEVVLLTSGDIGLAPIFPWPVGYIYTWRTEKVRKIFIRKAKIHSVIYVDLFREKKDDLLLKDVDRNYAFDGLHLSGDGYGIWYAEIKKTLRANNILILDKSS